MNEPFKLFVTNYRHIFMSGVETYDPIETEDLTNIDGLMVQFTGGQPPQSVLYSTPLAGANGANYNSNRLNTRNIVLTFSLLSNQEANRLRIYSLFRTGSKVRLEFHTYRRAWIEGFVESITENRFSAQRKQVIQVSIICYKPLFTSVDTNVYKYTGSNLPAHLYINYGGDVRTGIKLKITCSGGVGDARFTNRTDSRHAVLSGGIIIINQSFANGDVIYINTNDGEKDVYYIDSNNVRHSLLNNVLNGIDWFGIVTGQNDFWFRALTGQANISELELTVVEVYEGI